jgi:hypothetical protein
VLTPENVVERMEAKGLQWVATLHKPLHGTGYSFETPRELYKRQKRNGVLVEFIFASVVFVFEQTVPERVSDWHEWFAAKVTTAKAVAA